MSVHKRKKIVAQHENMAKNVSVRMWENVKTWWYIRSMLRIDVKTHKMSPYFNRSKNEYIFNCLPIKSVYISNGIVVDFICHSIWFLLPLLFLCNGIGIPYQWYLFDDCARIMVFIISRMILPVKVMQFYTIPIYQFSCDLNHMFLSFVLLFNASAKVIFFSCSFVIGKRQHQWTGILRAYIKTIFDCFTWRTSLLNFGAFGWIKRINSKEVFLQINSI